MKYRFRLLDYRLLLAFCFIPIAFPIAIGSLLVQSCSQNTTPTQGLVKIGVDESFRPLFEAEVDAFEGFYKNAVLVADYKPEVDLISDFKKDSTRMLVLGRDLTDDEKKYFEAKKSFPKSTRIGVDALAFIVHKENKIDNLLYSEVEKIFKGETTAWSVLDPDLKGDTTKKIKIVFDNDRSVNVRMLKEKLLGGADFPKNTFAVNSNPEVIDFVSKDKQALGIIGVNWISDEDDSITRGFQSQIKVLGISSEENPGEYFQPYQAYIHSREYPFCRDMYVINREGRTGLGTGFAAFIAGEKGQLIILKAGMVPATQPIRTVTIKSE